MYVLKDNGVILEREHGNNFGYILSENKYFVNTDYKVLQSQSSGIFVPCMKMIYNGKIELYYITDDFRPMSTMFAGITPDILINIVINMFGSVVEVRNNGFLQSQNIDISWDKIFVDPSTLKVKLTYLPINVKAFDSYAEFESELRSSLVKLINKLITASNDRLDRFVPDLVNGSMTIEDIYNKYKGTGMPELKHTDTSMPANNAGTALKLVAMNSTEHFETELDRPQTTLGKKQELVDVVVGFNKMISRKHCTVFHNNGTYCIADEGSANGTYVNGVRVVQGQKIPIKKGDIIRMADSDFQLI
jgi:hypothetical protein